MSETMDMDRLEDLLALKLERALTADESGELKKLLAMYPEVGELDFELAAGALLAASPERAPLPPELRQKLIAAVAKPTAAMPAAISRRSALAWASAAVAAGLAAVGWWPRLFGGPVRAPSIEERRALLLARGIDVVTLPFAAAGDPIVPKIEGDLVWSTATQSGFMRFVSGLPANDPGKNQYQLWIFDGKRDDRYPVDGGVFDIDGPRERIVEILPKVRVHQPTLFAVTLEPPGGVVVSAREHILVVAKPA